MTEDEVIGWHHRLNGHEFESRLQELVMDREAQHAEVRGVAKSWTRLSDCTEPNPKSELETSIIKYMSEKNWKMRGT